MSELKKAENERKIKEYEAKYNFNYNENAQDNEVIDKLLSGDVDMELMEKLAERRIKSKQLMMVPHLAVEILETLVKQVKPDQLAVILMRINLLLLLVRI